MAIKKPARGESDGEIVPWNESESNVREEVLRRSAKAGYCTRYGEPVGASKIQSRNPWGQTKLNVWPRDAENILID